MSHPHQRRPDPFYDKLGERTSGKNEVRLQGTRRKENSYERIGLYLNSPTFGHENFADVHLRWNTQVDGPKNTRNYFADFVDAWFAGPLSSVRQITVLQRSHLDIDEYARYRSVSPDLDIENGGNALVVETGNFVGLEIAKRFTGQPAHIWLFGPLNYLNYQYGSLFVTLTGNFAPGHGFQHLVVRGSSYAEGAEAFPIPRDGLTTAEQTAAAYANRVDGTFSIPLPTKARRWEWKIEAYRRHLTGYELSNKRDGLPKRK
jgi:hypothetical protein